MTTLSEDLATKILTVLMEQKLLLAEDVQKFATSLSAGEAKLGDWRLAIEKALDKAVNE